MRIGKSRVSNLQANTFTRVYTNTLAAAATSVTISGLTGDTDEVYRLIVKLVAGADNSALWLRINNDSTNTLYGSQNITGANTTIAASRTTTGISAMILSNTSPDVADNDILYVDLEIQAKSGFERTAIGTTISEVTGTTITDIMFSSYSYNETATEITSLVLLSATNGLGVGTQIDLYRLVRST